MMKMKWIMKITKKGDIEVMEEVEDMDIIINTKKMDIKITTIIKEIKIKMRKNKKIIIIKNNLD